MSARILIVDDEPNLLRLIGYALGIEGYDVVTAESGTEALRKVRTEQPDLMILDVMLPDMSGVEVCQRIRSNLETVNLPIVMLSARAQVSDKIEGLKAGADEYLTKPIDSDEMVARVAALLERTRRLHQVQRAQYGRVIGFVGAKGGVGTTTVALNVASVLATQGKTVVAVELRSCYGTFAPQLGYTPVANPSSWLGLDPERINRRDVNAALVTLPSGLKVLFGPQTVDEFRDIEPALVGAVIDELAATADYVIIDLPRHPFGASQAALRHCDAVVLVVEREPTSVIAGRVALELLRSWSVRGIAGAVVVSRAALPVPMSFTEIRSGLGCELVGVVPPAAEACVAAQVQGGPLVLYQPGNAAAASLTEIARRLAADKITAPRF